jgi:hypothetical protein
VEEAVTAVAQVIHAIDADVIALQEIEHSTILIQLQDKVRDLGTNYPHAFISQGSDSFTGQDVAVLSKFAAVGAPIRRFPDERETYDSEEDPGAETDTGLSKVLAVTLDVAGTEVPGRGF